MKHTNQNAGLLILRLAVGVLMTFHGVAKIFHGIAPVKNMLATTGLPQFLGYGVYVGEIIFPLLIIVGYRTRLAALGLALNMIAAVYLAHPGDLFSITASGGWALELQGLYFFGAIALFFTGAGRYAISHRSYWD